MHFAASICWLRLIRILSARTRRTSRMMIATFRARLVVCMCVVATQRVVARIVIAIDCINVRIFVDIDVIISYICVYICMNACICMYVYAYARLAAKGAMHLR